MTTRVWGKPFQNHHQESSHNLLQRTICTLTSISWAPRSSANSWPAQLTRFDQDKHTHKHSNSKKTRVHRQLIHVLPLTQNWKLSKKYIVQEIPVHFYCIWNMLPRALAWNIQIFVFPWGICPRIPVFKRAVFLYQQFLEATVVRFGFVLLLWFFFSPKELIVNCLKISLEKLRGESNVSFWQLYYSTVCTLWPPLFLAGSLVVGENLFYGPRDLL